MPPNAPDASDGDSGHRRLRGGRSRLAGIRKDRRNKDPETRERIMEAALATSGELGYRQATVAATVERYGGYRLQFYEQFGSYADSYAAAHAVHTERLTERLLGAGAVAEAWRAGLRAALEELGSFACGQPALARGLLAEVHVAGNPALVRRQQGLERLSRALDSARRETGSRHSPPPLTAPFMVSAIESSVVRALTKDEPQRFVQAIPEIEQMISAAYFGRPLHQV
jgi:AcrR family transcriptional regulator